MTRLAPWFVALVVTVALAAGCTGDRPRLAEEVAATVDPTVDPTVEPTPRPAASTGEVTVNDVVYGLDFRCFEVDEGSAFAVGKGVDPADAEPVTALVQMLPGSDYVSLVFGDVETGTAWEPALDADVILARADGVMRAEGIEFVEFVDGVGQSVGVGAVEVRCDVFEVDGPEAVLPP